MTVTTEACRSSWIVRIGYVLVILALASMGVFWAVLTPPATSVDEPIHVNSVVRLMQGGGWPAPQSAPVLEATGVATLEAGRAWMNRSWDDMQPPEELPPPEQRSVIGHLDDPLTRDGEIMIDWMTQHPPTWYAIAAGTMSVLGADDWRWDQLYFGLRVLSVMFVTGGAVFVLASVKRITESPTAAMVGTLAIFTTGQFFNVLARATNDSLAILAGSGFLYFLVRALTAKHGWRSRWIDSLSAGVLLGIGLLTKGTLLTAIPVVFVALVVAGLRAGGGWFRRVAPAFASMFVAFAVGGWYYFRNILVYGEIQSSNSGTGRNESPFEEYSLIYYLQTALTRVATSFWESTRPYLDIPGALIGVLVLLTAFALLCVAVASPQRGNVAILAIYPVCVVGLLIFHGWEVYWNNGRLVGLQGRYLFPSIIVYCALFGIAWRIIFGKRSALVRCLSVIVLGTLFVGFGFWAATTGFNYRWLEDSSLVPDGWEEMATSGAVPAWVAAVIAGTAVLTAVGAVVLAGISAVTQPTLHGPEAPRNASPVGST